MTKEQALALLNSILDTHIKAVGEVSDPGEARTALENARQDLELHVSAVVDECLQQSLDDAIAEAEEITRGE